jgi:hypothetical protein
MDRLLSKQSEGTRSRRVFVGEAPNVCLDAAGVTHPLMDEIRAKFAPAPEKK